METIITMYVGKEMVKVDLTNLFGVEVTTLKKISYDIAKKYPDFIAALEVAAESYPGGAVNITDENTYNDAMARIIDIINIGQEDTTMEQIFNAEDATVVADVDYVEVVDNTTTKEDVVMEDMKSMMMDENGNLDKEGIKKVIDNIAAGATNIVGDVKEDVADNVEQAKAHFVSVSGLLGILGLRKLKADYDRIIYAGTNDNGGLTKIDAMAKEMTKLCKEEIARLEYFSTDKTVAQAFALKCLVGDTYTDKNIFECIASGLLCIIKKVTTFLKDKYNLMEEKAKSAAAKSVLRGIRALFCGIIQGAIIIIKIGLHCVNLVVSGAIALGYWAFNTIKKLCLKIAAWVSGKVHKNDEDDFDFDESFTEEDYMFVSPATV